MNIKQLIWQQSRLSIAPSLTTGARADTAENRAFTPFWKSGERFRQSGQRASMPSASFGECSPIRIIFLTFMMPRSLGQQHWGPNFLPVQKPYPIFPILSRKISGFSHSTSVTVHHLRVRDNSHHAICVVCSVPFCQNLTAALQMFSYLLSNSWTLSTFGILGEMDSRLRGNDANDTPHIRCHSREGGNPFLRRFRNLTK
jgi:hypothetical protein